MNCHIRCFFWMTKKQECLERDQRQQVDSNQVLVKPLAWIGEDTLVKDDQNRLCSKKILMAKRAHANLYEDPFPSYLTASSLPPLESPPPPADLLSLSKYQVAFFSSENRKLPWSSLIFWRQLDMNIVVFKTHFLWTKNRVSCKGCYRTFRNQD